MGDGYNNFIGDSCINIKKKNNANKIKHQMINSTSQLICFEFANQQYHIIIVPREQFWSKSKPEPASKSVGSAKHRAVWDPENRIGPRNWASREARRSSTGADSTRCASRDGLGKYKRSKAFRNCECSHNALNISGGSIVVLGGEILFFSKARN